MARRRPFKQDLTPLRKDGPVTTHTGKGATEQRRGLGGGETLTGGDPYRSAANRYPKLSLPTRQPVSPLPLSEEE